METQPVGGSFYCSLIPSPYGKDRGDDYHNYRNKNVW